MEHFWREHPFVRWTVIALLLLGIVIEGLYITNWIAVSGARESAEAGSPVGGGDEPAEPEGVSLACRVLVWVNFREGPSIENEVITQLPPDTPFTAVGRSGEVPWLRARLEDGREGWLSSRSNDEVLAECEGDLQTLPAVEQPSAGADEPEAEAERATITVEPALRLREGNGPDLHAARRTFPVALDGNLEEWTNTSAATIDQVVFKPENWAGPDDLRGQVRAAWDDGFLYLAVQATDDQIVQESEGDQLILGDAVEFFWDADLQRDFEEDEYNADEVQLVVSPGNFVDKGVAAWVYVAQTGNFAEEINAAAQRTGRGYDIEIRLPWSHLSVTPQPGAVYGYAVALSDDDTPSSGEQETQLSTTPEIPFRHPVHWGNFILEP